MMNVKRIALSLLLSVVMYCSQAQEILLLDDVVQQTLENNYKIKIAANTTEREALKVTRGNAGQLPDVSLGGRYGVIKGDSEVETLDDSSRLVQIDRVFENIDLEGSINVDYTLFDGLAMFRRYAVLQENADLAKLNEREASENVITQAISNYMEALRSQQRYFVLKESLEASKQRYEFVQRRVKAGSATNLDELNAQVDMINDSSALVEASLNSKNASYELQYLMGKRDYAAQVALDNSFSIDENLSLVDMQSSSREKNVFIQQSAKNIDISSLQYKLSESAKYPTIGANGSYSWSQSETPLTFPRSRNGTAISGQIRVSFDLFNGGRKNIAQQAAKIDLDNTILTKEDVSQMIAKDLLIAFQNYSTRLQILTLLNGNLANAEENFSNSEKSYQAGVITSVELRQAQVNLANAKNRINDAKIDAKLAEINVKRLGGVLLD